MNHCQSCGMPLGDTEEWLGRERDGGLSPDYCKHCYDRGEFRAQMTMDQMIEFCIPHLVRARPEMSPAEARKLMEDMFPRLKRWRPADQVGANLSGP